jgi:5'-nucleotidase
MPAVGGVARRATKINEARAANQFVLLLDAGDSLTGDQLPAKSTQGRTSVEIMNRLGYDALTLGPQDLLLGLEALRQRTDEARFALLSANALATETGAHIAQPFVLRSVGTHHVALIGLSGDFGELSRTAAGGITVTDPQAAAAAAVVEAAGQADIIILLSHAGLAVDQAIAAAVPGIDVIVSGGPGGRPEPARNPTTGTLIVHADEAQPGHAGRVLGMQTLDFDASGQLQNAQIEYIQLGPEIADDAEVAAWLLGAMDKEGK